MITDDYCDINGEILKKNILIQVDIENKINKFYIMQMIKSNNVPITYITYARLGNVGNKGRIEKNTFKTEAECTKFFTDKYKLLTGLIHTSYYYFNTPLKGYYTSMENEIPLPTNIIPCEIVNNDDDDDMDEELKKLLKIMSFKKQNTTTVKVNKTNASIFPLGKMSASVLSYANQYLNYIAVNLAKKTQTPKIKKLYISYSNIFFSLVPYSCKKGTPFIINTKELLAKAKEIYKLHQTTKITYKEINYMPPINFQEIYNNLDAKIVPLKKKFEIYQELVKYVENSHGMDQTMQLEIKNIYKITKKTDEIYDNYAENFNNRILLFHGSSAVNWCSIIKNGLISDPAKKGITVRMTGKMFGEGTYWSNSITKSFTYCYDSIEVGAGIIAVGEICLGNSEDLYNSDYTLNSEKIKEKRKHSVHGMGKYTPESFKVKNDVIIPNGKLKLSSDSADCNLNYDEFVIYNTEQYKLKYLILLEKKKVKS